MARNIEIKARISEVGALAQLAANIASEGPIELVQDDTFFLCASGRLKLRVFADGAGELIFYRRTKTQGPKESFYLRSPVSDPVALREVLSAAYGECGRVRKHRRLFLKGRTRIHLDHVEGLGDFVELEVVLADGDNPDEGALEARELMARLGIRDSALIEGSYIDLLQGVG